MAQSPEVIKTRLENIHSIEPLLAALRTISLSNWRFSLKKIEIASGYLNKLYEIYNQLLPSNKTDSNTHSNPNHLLIAIGSNRGLCGNFNRDIIKNLSNLLSKSINNFQVIIIGERLRKLLDRKKLKYDHYLQFPNASDLNPSFTQNIFSEFLQSNKNGFSELLFNQYRGAGQYRTTQSNIFPNDFLNLSSYKLPLDDFVFDTTSEEIQKYLNEHLVQLSLYFALLSSAASEHSTRFQLMENASNNAEKLAEELFIEVQVQRRQKITSEMQELAIGAGLLEKRGGKKPRSGFDNF